MGLYQAQSGILVEAVAQSEAEAEIVDGLAKLIKQAHSQFAKLDYGDLSKIKDIEGMLRGRVRLLAPHGVKLALKQQREIVRKAFAKADPTHSKKFFDALGQYKAPKQKKRPTFKKARDAILEYLKKKGWTVKTWGPSGQLKVPHATAPYMHGPKLWFKTQAVYVSGAKDKFGDARSTWDDIRDMTPEQFVKGVERTFRESVLGDGPVLTEASAQIKVYPFKHPHTSWKDPSRVSLKVRKGDMSPADFKAALKQAGIELHPEFPKIITGGVYEIAVVSKKDWEAHGQKVQASAKATPKVEPKKEPMSLEGMKLSPAEIKLLRKIYDEEIGPLYGGHPAPGDLILYPKKDMQKINLVAGMMNKKWKDTDGKQKTLLYVRAKDWSWVGGPYDQPEIVPLKTPADVHKAAKKGDTIYVSTRFSTWEGSGKTTHAKFFSHHKKVHGH